MKISKDASKSFFVDVLGQFGIQFLTIFAVSIYLNNLSEVHYGYWLTILSLLAWIALADLGIGMSLTRRLIEVISLKNEEQKHRLVSTGILAFLGLSILFFFIGVSLMFFLHSWLNIPEQDKNLFQITFLVCIVTGSFSLFFGTFSAIIEAHKKLTVNRLISILSRLLGLVTGVIFLVFTDLNILSLALGMSTMVFFKGGVSFWYSKKVFSWKFYINEFDREHLKKLISFGGYFQIARLANTVAVSADNIVITSILGAALVTPYNLTVKLTNLLGVTIASKIPTALFPSITVMVVENRVDKLKALVYNMINLLTRICLLAGCLVFFMNESFVTLWVGSDQYGGDFLTSIFVYWILFEVLVRGFSMIIYAYGELKQLAVFSIFEAISNLLLSIILGKMMGLVGIALATAISRTFTIGLYLPYFLWKKELIDRNSLKLILKIILMSTPMILVVSVVSHIEVNQLFLSIVLIGVVTMITNIICFDYKELRKVLRREISLIQLPKEILKKYAS